MPLAFPNNPSQNQTYTYGGSTWIFNGVSWTKTISSAGANIAAVSDRINTSTGYLHLPAGTTNQRPIAPRSGMMRYNTSTLNMEYYDGPGWPWIKLHRHLVQRLM
jgi:hypothetical protein